MPAVAQPYTPPAVQGNVIALYAQGESKRKIAKELGISRNTVDMVLARYSQTEPTGTTRLQRIIPKAYDAVDKAVTAGDARIAMDILKLELGQRSSNVYHVAGDLALNTAIGFVPSTTSTSSTAVSTGPTEAPQKPTQLSIGVSNQTNFSANFSQFSLAELEAEVARRKAQLIEVQPEPTDGAAR